MTYSIKTRRAITNYGMEDCVRAYRMSQRGEGAATIAFTGPATIHTTRQADAAINAGEEIVRVVNEIGEAVLEFCAKEGERFTITLSKGQWNVISPDGTFVGSRGTQAEADGLVKGLTQNV
jgi:hypothetical protein